MQNLRYLRKMTHRTRRIRTRLAKIIGKMKSLCPQDRTRILALFGIDGHCSHIPASDMSAREEALRILYRCTEVFFAEIPVGTSIFHGTFATDIGLTTDREAHFRLRALRGKVDRAIRELGLNGIVVFEVQALTNHPGNGAGYYLMLHAHAILWGMVNSEKLQAKVDKINRSRAWPNHFGALPIKLRLLSAGEFGAQFIASYLLKPPCSAVRLIRKPWGWRFTPVLNGYRDHLLLRIMEGLSAYSIYEIIAGIGDGKFIRKRFKAELEQWHRTRAATEAALQPFNFPVPWARVRRRYHNRGYYRPFVIE